MFSAFVIWWYGRGLGLQFQSISKRFARWVDFFSFEIISKTLFAPFRQIAATQVSGSLDDKFRAWLDRQFSRGVGFWVRTLTLIAGVLWLGVVALISLLQLICWVLAPVVPFLGLLLSLIGWMPWQN